VTATTASRAAPESAGSRRWLFGPASDLLFGCGLAYAAIFVVLAAAGDRVREALPFGIALVPINLVLSAHYGATAIRAYEKASDRRAYAMFTLWTTLLLGVGFVWGLRDTDVGSWIITLYLTWSPWHYAGQNFGVALLFLRRREVEVTPRARLLLHASFVLSWVLSLLALHIVPQGVHYAPSDGFDTSQYAFLPLGPRLGIPAGVGAAAMIVTAVAYLACTAGATALLRRKGSWREIAPALLLIATQALWFSVPVLMRHWGALGTWDPFSIENAAYAFLWIGLGHGLQYLWITTYFARRSDPSRSGTSFVLRSLLAGTALWVVPATLFAPGLIGQLPYDAGLATMVAALVNLHHFVLDGVIWKLRDARIAGILVRSQDTGEPPPPMPAAWRIALWGAGAVVLALAVVQTYFVEFRFNRSLRRRGEDPYALDKARAADEVLDSLGWRSAERPLQLGHIYLEQGDLDLARRSFEKSLAAREDAWAWVGIGEIHHRRGEAADAGEAYAKALRLDPDHAAATFYAGVLALEQGQRDRGRRLVARARELAGRDAKATQEMRDTIDAVLADVQAQDAESAPPR
jgi:hypothetical protein